GPSRTFNVGTTDQHVAASFVGAQLVATELSITLEPGIAPENRDTPVIVKGILLRRDTSQGIANKPIVVSFRGQQRTLLTDSRGFFQSVFTVNLPAGAYTFTASFSADSQFGSSSATATLRVLRIEILVPTKLTLTIDRSVIQADTLETVRLSGKLIRADTGEGLAGKNVYIIIPGESNPIPVVTDPTGAYGLVYGVKVSAGTYSIKARFDGEKINDTLYEASSASVTLQAVATTIKINFVFLDVFTRVGSLGGTGIWGAIRYTGPKDVDLVVHLIVNGEILTFNKKIPFSFLNHIPPDTYFIDFYAGNDWPKIAKVQGKQKYIVQASLSIVDKNGKILANSKLQEEWGKDAIVKTLRDALQKLKDYGVMDLPQALPNIAFPSSLVDSAGYNGLTNEIRVNELAADNAWYIFHEFGHFLEDKWYTFNLAGDCPSPRDGCKVTNAGCAIKEGWADFIAEVLTHDRPYLQYGLENYNCQIRGKEAEKVELAIAGILWDLYDGQNEPFDKIKLPLSEIVSLVKDSLKPTSKGLWTIYENFRERYSRDLVKLFEQLLKEGYGIDYSSSIGSSKTAVEDKAPHQSSGSVRFLVEKLTIDPNPIKISDMVTLRVEGIGITGVKVEVFDLTGRKVVEYETDSNIVNFRAVDSTGYPLANGVYLCVFTIKGGDGRIERRIEKLVILK
ncbi:MAG: T9SS type A sorting domain-containing protein, partial [Candidatus Bipolaricaulaceae bacterium]